MTLFTICDPSSLVQSGPLLASAQREAITPHKLSLMTLVNLYCETTLRGSAPLLPAQRKEACLLLLQLLQGGELDIQGFERQCQRRLPPIYVTNLRERLERLSKESVEGITDLMASTEVLLVDPTTRKPFLEIPVSATSVVGMFIRRMVLEYSRMPFHEITRVVAEFSAYYNSGRSPAGGSASARVEETSGDVSDLSCNMSMDLSTEDVKEEGELRDGSRENALDVSSPDPLQRPSRRQAELMVSQQLELLQLNEKLALDPAALQTAAARLLRDAPDLAEVHFLSYLNCLRVGELSGAVHSLYHSFDRIGPGSGSDDDSRGLRYAALSLAALHARFGHRQAALAAIREAVTMSQDGNDSVCLQQALTWLYKLAEDDETRETLMRHAIVKSGELQLPELASLGVQNYTVLMARRGAKPSEAFQQLARSDQLTCQHSLPLLMSSGYAVRAALCELYGRPALGALCAQLLLCLETSGGATGAPVCGEPVALAASQLSRYLSSDGEYALAEQVLSWASDQFPPGSDNATMVRRHHLELECDRALLAGRCQGAEQAATSLTGLDPSSGRLRRAQVHLLRGELSECGKLLDTLLAESPLPQRKVQLLLLRAELLSAAADFSSAAEPVLSALAECERRGLQGCRRSVLLRLASLQLQLGLRQQAAELAESLTLPLLTHGAPIERARLRLLQARCLLAGDSAQPRDALPLLEEAARTLHSIEAWLLLKTVLYTRAVVFHQLGERADRNAAASQYRQLVTLHPTADGAHLIRIA